MNRFTRLAPSGSVDTDAASRTVRYVFSDESVGRDGHIVRTSAWRTINFAANPVFLWAHDDGALPIGRVFDLHTQSRELRGAVRYAETDFADSVYQLVRGGFLSAVSTSWQPLAFDRMPDGRGLIFTDVDLLEISQVPVPALATALATARSRVNTLPLYEWATRALDTGRPGTLDRPLLEAICRAASPTRTSRSGAEDRRRRAQAIQARLRADRVRRARELQHSPGVSRSMSSVVQFETRRFSVADRNKLRGVERHLAKAIGHHSKLEGHHDVVGEHIRDAHAARRELTSTLKELGEGRAARTTSTLAGLGYDHHRVTRALAALGESLSALSKVHGDAEATAGDAEDCVRQARAALGGMVGTDE